MIFGLLNLAHSQLQPLGSRDDSSSELSTTTWHGSERAIAIVTLAVRFDHVDWPLVYGMTLVWSFGEAYANVLLVIDVSEFSPEAFLSKEIRLKNTEHMKAWTAFDVLFSRRG